MSLLRVIAALALLLSFGCASSGPMYLEPGLTKSEVMSIMGEPNDRSFRGSDEAWQYQELVGFGQCRYTTLWLRDGQLVGVTSRRGSSVAGCGLGSDEVNWNEMPEEEPRQKDEGKGDSYRP